MAAIMNSDVVSDQSHSTMYASITVYIFVRRERPITGYQGRIIVAVSCVLLFVFQASYFSESEGFTKVFNHMVMRQH